MLQSRSWCLNSRHPLTPLPQNLGSPETVSAGKLPGLGQIYDWSVSQLEIPPKGNVFAYSEEQDKVFNRHSYHIEKFGRHKILYLHQKFFAYKVHEDNSTTSSLV